MNTSFTSLDRLLRAPTDIAFLSHHHSPATAPPAPLLSDSAGRPLVPPERGRPVRWSPEHHSSPPHRGHATLLGGTDGVGSVHFTFAKIRMPFFEAGNFQSGNHPPQNFTWSWDSPLNFGFGEKDFENGGWALPHVHCRLKNVIKWHYKEPEEALRMPHLSMSQIRTKRPSSSFDFSRNVVSDSRIFVSTYDMVNAQLRWVKNWGGHRHASSSPLVCNTVTHWSYMFKVTASCFWAPSSSISNQSAGGDCIIGHFLLQLITFPIFPFHYLERKKLFLPKQLSNVSWYSGSTHGLHVWKSPPKSKPKRGLNKVDPAVILWGKCSLLTKSKIDF